MSTSSARLATELRNADEGVAAFRAFYQEHLDLVWRVLRRLGVRGADLEDICQEVFLAAHRRLPSFEGRSAVRTWLYSIAVHCAWDHRRRAHVVREVATETPDVGVGEASQLVSIERREARQRLDAIIASLDDDKRAVFVLYELEELPMSEVAEVVGCPLQTAYSRLHAARRKVAEAVTQDGGGA